MSGSTIGGVVGGVIGFYVGGPAGAQWGWMIGSVVGGAVDPDVIKGPRLTDPQQQTAAEGAPIPLIYAMGGVLGTIIQCQSTPTEHKHKESTGKGGPVQETYTYTRTVAIAICQAAPLGGENMLRRAWVNGKLAYDATGAGKIDSESAKFLTNMRFYSGSETQTPDSALEALPAGDGGGVGNVPAYRGLCYAVLPDCDVTQGGGAVPTIKWEIVSHGTETSTCAEDDLVAWWPLDDAAAGGTAREVVAGKNGTYSSGVTSGGALRAGSGGSARFTAIGQYMAADNYPIEQVKDMTEWTVSAWARPELIDGVNVGGAGRKIIAGYYTARSGGFFAGAHDWELTLLGPSSPAIDKNMTPHAGCTLSDGTSAFTVDGVIAEHGDTIFMAMSWKHEATDDSDRGTARLYVNGALVDTASNVYNSHHSADTIVAGGSTEYTSSYQFIGEVSDVKVYSRALSETELADKYRTVEEWRPMPDGGGYYNRDGETFSACVHTVVADGLDLADVQGDLIARGTVEDYDTSALIGTTVTGYTVAQPTTSAAASKELQKVYLYDLPEWGNSGDDYVKLRAVPRGGANVFSITDDDLVDVDSDEDTRAQQVELARVINVVASDPDHAYEPIKQTSERYSENVKSESEVTFSTASLFDRDQLSQRADIFHKIQEAESKGTITRTLPEEFTALVPSDCGTVNGKRYRVQRIDQQDGTVQVEMVRDRPSAYTSSATGSTGVTVPDPVTGTLGPTVCQILNLTSLTAKDNVPGMYVFVCGLFPAWAGCDLYMSVDGGLSEQKVATILNPATMGWLTADLAISGTTLSVQLYNEDELDDATSDQLAARMNACAITTAGVSEILQFADATDTGTKTYDLATLTRGELSTTETDHFTDDDFAMLDGSQFFLPIDASFAGQTLTFRPVTRGTVPANNETITVTFDPPTFVIDGGGA